MPVAERVGRQLQNFGVSCITFISDPPCDSAAICTHHQLCPLRCRMFTPKGEQLWQAAEETFQKFAEDGADLVFALRLGPYVEVDYEEMIQHHLDRRCAVTLAVDSENQPLDLFVLSASARDDAAALFKNRMQRMRRECAPFHVKGYVNRLETSADLRRLAVDGLLAKNAIRPEGNEDEAGNLGRRWAHEFIARRAWLLPPTSERMPRFAPPR